VKTIPASFGRRGRTRRTWILFVALALGALVIWPLFAGYYTDWLWYESLGYQIIFTRVILAKLVIGLIVGLATGLLTWLSLRLALRFGAEPPAGERLLNFNNETIAVPNLASIVRRLALPWSVVIGAFFAAQGWQNWETILKFWFQVPFNETDPIFGRDIGYYFFTLPLLDLVSELLIGLVILALIGALAADFARQSILVTRSGLLIDRGAKRHLFCLVALLFTLLAWRAYLGRFELLYSTRGPVSGVSYTDHSAVLPMLTVELIAALLAAALALVSAFTKRTRLVLPGAAIYVAVVVLGGWIYPGLVQRFSVAPNELTKEAPYIVNNIKATRRAFGLGNVEERELTGTKALTGADIQVNRQTINSIRLWDKDPLLDTFTQIQEIRTYYNFKSVDNDRYRIGNELRQIMISARELSTPSLPSRNWINERLTYTHGFGLTLGPVNHVVSGGLPDLWVKNIPPESTVPELKVVRPEIYFGELTNDYAYVRTKTEEFNYPSGEQNVFASYAGDGGVSIGSTWRRSLFGTRFGDMKLLLSNEIQPESRVLFDRNIAERLAKVAPFLHFDSDPYLVISEGRLFWMCDAYTESDLYPNAQPSGEINYIRNSVKAVVDAYHGSVRLYLADANDPMIATYARMFPGIIAPLSAMHEDLRRHIRFPEDLFRRQTAVYSTYHMNEPQVFYNREDQWEVASAGESQGQPRTMEPYYSVMKLLGERAEEFLLMLPFTPRSKDNLAAWMVARADGEHYGHLLVYRFPKQRVVWGPKQVIGLINQDAEISRQLTLWNQRGSQVIFGTLLVVPIEEGLVYVQPLFLRAESGKIPELKRVIVVVQDRPIAMEETLEASLSRVFGGNVAPVHTEETETKASLTTPVEGLAAQASEHFEKAQQARRDGDWARFGEELKKLGEVIDQMNPGKQKK
jgi:uncharacterized membrane protein (UPF0182 family)